MKSIHICVCGTTNLIQSGLGHINGKQFLNVINQIGESLL